LLLCNFQRSSEEVSFFMLERSVLSKLNSHSIKPFP
jgi:hypothetical protein